jgi:hypothetical protein
VYTITVSTDKSKTFQEVPTFPAAWNMAKKEATDLAERISEAQDCYVSMSFEKENQDIIVHDIQQNQFTIFHVKEKP